MRACLLYLHLKYVLPAGPISMLNIELPLHANARAVNKYVLLCMPGPAPNDTKTGNSSTGNLLMFSYYCMS